VAREYPTNLEDALTAKLSSFLSLQWRGTQTNRDSNAPKSASLRSRDDNPMSGDFKRIFGVCGSDLVGGSGPCHPFSEFQHRVTHYFPALE
jgi:hypothetical protein